MKKKLEYKDEHLQDLTSHYKEVDACKRLCAELLIIVFNDILTKEYYRYHMHEALRYSNKTSWSKICRHMDAIEWLMNEECEVRNLCFSVLGINGLSKIRIQSAIMYKFNGDQKFIKFFRLYSREQNDTAKIRILQKGAKYLKRSPTTSKRKRI